MYFLPGLLPADPLATVHQWLSWGFVVYMGLHVMAQVIMGGVRQLLKIVTPRAAYGLGAAFALVAGLGGAAFAYVLDSSSQPVLTFVKTSALPVLDGDGNDDAWKQAPESVVHTARGFNLDGGEVDVHIRALHDGTRAYLLFRWQDATRQPEAHSVAEDRWRLEAAAHQLLQQR